MPAPSTEKLYDFKTNFAVATAKILAASGFTQEYLERQCARLQATLRYEISFDLGEALNEEPLANGDHVYDFYAATLRIRIVSARRPKPAGLGTELRELHDLFVARTLAQFEERRHPFDALLSWYAVKMIRPLGTGSGFDPLYAEDYTDISFALQFGIKSDAWPA